MSRRETFGQYRILKRMAVGEMARVFLAVCDDPHGLQRVVVLKAMREDLDAEPEVRQMFLDEARIAARLKHPNIVHLYDVGAEGEVPYLVMEYVFGSDLIRVADRARRRKRAVPISFAVRVMADAVAGLHHASSLGERDGLPLQIVHRDVSPENLLVSFDGVTRLLDFGIARARIRLSKTRGGALKGKVPYMSPEQVRNRTLDQRSDQFSLAVVIYELLSGTRLFARDNEFDAMKAVEECEVPPLLELRSDVPRPLADVVHRSLQRAPEERFASWRGLEAELGRVPAATELEQRAQTVGFLEEMFGDELARRRVRIRDAEEGERWLLLDAGFEFLDEEPTQPRPRPGADVPLAHARHLALQQDRQHLETDPAGGPPLGMRQPPPLPVEASAVPDMVPDAVAGGDTDPATPLLPPDDADGPAGQDEATVVLRDQGPKTVKRAFLGNRAAWILLGVLVVVGVFLLIVPADNRPAEKQKGDGPPAVTHRHDQRQANAWLAAGRARLEAFDFDGAEAALRDALAADPGNSEALDLLLRVERERRYAARLAHARQVLAEGTPVRAWDQVASIPAESIVRTRASGFLSDLKGRLVRHHLAVAAERREEGDLLAVLRHLDRALAVAPGDPDALALQRAIGDELEERQLAVDPGEGEARTSSGRAGGRLDGAGGPARQAQVTSRPRKARRLSRREKKLLRSLIARGRKLARQKHYDQALEAFAKAIEMDATSCDAWVNAGSVHAMRGARESAASHYSSFVELCPHHPKAPRVRRYLQQYEKYRDKP